MDPPPEAEPPREDEDKGAVGLETTPRPDETIKISMQITPPTARIFLDDHQSRDNPILLPRTDKKIQLRVEAKGYKTREMTMLADRDRSMIVALSRVRPVKVKTKGRARSRSKQGDGDGPTGANASAPGPKAKPEVEAFSTLKEPAPAPETTDKEEEKAFDSL